MKIIKLDAIDSTNTFLKELAQSSVLEDYTIVTADQQLSGRGQMNSSWISEPYKNLTFSIFTRFKNITIEQQSYLNFAVSLAIFEVLESLSVPKLTIKWPNDILSGNQKICGILVETTFAKQRIKNTVIGIGLNVNQEKFPDHLNQASSLKNLLGASFDLNDILHAIIQKVQYHINLLEEGEFESIYESYQRVLYLKEIPTTFKNKYTQTFFMGMIKGVSTDGKLLIQLEDDSIQAYGIKEISFARV